MTEKTTENGNPEKEPVMKKARALLLHCWEEVYPVQWLKTVIDEMETGIRSLDSVEIAGSYELKNNLTAAEAVSGTEKLTFDFIIVNIVSWHITPYIMSVLKNHPDKPLLVYSTGGRTDASGKLHSPASPAALTALTPVLKDLGYRFKVIYEKPNEPHKFNRIGKYAHIISAYKQITNARIGLIGYADMGLFTCVYDKTEVFKKLGIEIEDYFSYEIGKVMDDTPQSVIDTVKSDIKARTVFTNEVSDAALDRAARLYYAMKNKADDRGLSALSIKCVSGATKFMGINPCMAQSLLADRNFAVICECDAHGLITTVMLSALTGRTAVFMENYEFLDEQVLAGICGFLPKDFSDGEHMFKSSRLGDFFIGISCVSKVKTGPITLARLFKKGGSYAMFLSRAETMPPMKWTELGWEEPTPDFPSLLIKPEIGMERYVAECPGQHIVIVQGDCLDAMKDLCALMDIEVIS
jgi:L-fucose isomerase-like protein